MRNPVFCDKASHSSDYSYSGSGFETIGQIQIASRNPSNSWVNNDSVYDYVKIDSISLEQVNSIPEPSTYALILGAVALGFTIRRRK